jgi:hypothetical protein
MRNAFKIFAGKTLNEEVTCETKMYSYLKEIIYVGVFYYSFNYALKAIPVTSSGGP